MAQEKLSSTNLFIVKFRIGAGTRTTTATHQNSHFAHLSPPTITASSKTIQDTYNQKTAFLAVFHWLALNESPLLRHAKVRIQTFRALASGHRDAPQRQRGGKSKRMAQGERKPGNGSKSRAGKSQAIKNGDS